MSARIEMTGRVVGRLTILRTAGTNNHGDRLWLARCSCGKTKILPATDLSSGNTKSCGCLRREMGFAPTHGEANKSREYRAWLSMKNRVKNSKQQNFHNYGGRGITICARWLASFTAFLADMGRCPTGCSLDRKDNEGNYEPENCRWVTFREQAENRRRTIFITHSGTTLCAEAWSRETGIPRQTILRRHRRGLTPLEIFAK